MSTHTNRLLTHSPRNMAKARYDRLMSQPRGSGPNPNGDQDHQEGAYVWMAFAAIEFVALLGWFCIWVFS